MTDAAADAAAAAKKPVEVKYPIIMSARMPISNGGEVVMTAPPAATWDEAIANLQRTHELYLEYGIWGGGGR